MAGSRYKEHDWAKFQELYNNLGSWNKVIKETGISPTTLAKAKKDGHLVDTWIRKHAVDINVVQSLYDGGMSLRTIANQLNVAYSAVRYLGITLRTKSDSAKLLTPITHSVETKEKLSAIMSERMANRKVGSKRYVHNGITLESSWEKALAEDLDANNIIWNRPKPILYDDEGQTRRYYPDFYLLDYDVYLDPKNEYVQKLDERKLNLVREQTGINLLILGQNQLKWIEVIKLIGA